MKIDDVVWTHVFEYLSIKRLVRLMTINRFFYALVQSKSERYKLYRMCKLCVFDNIPCIDYMKHSNDMTRISSDYRYCEDTISVQDVQHLPVETAKYLLTLFPWNVKEFEHIPWIEDVVNVCNSLDLLLQSDFRFVKRKEFAEIDNLLGKISDYWKTARINEVIISRKIYFKNLWIKYQKGRNIVRAAAIYFCYLDYPKLSSELFDDKQFVLKLSFTDDEWHKYVSNNLKNDKDVMLKAITSSPNNILYASESLLDDKDIVLAAFRTKTRHLIALDLVSTRLRSDEYVVKRALWSNRENLQYALVLPTSYYKHLLFEQGRRSKVDIRLKTIIDLKYSDTFAVARNNTIYLRSEHLIFILDYKGIIKQTVHYDKFIDPRSMAIDSNGRLLVCDANRGIEIFDTNNGVKHLEFIEYPTVDGPIAVDCLDNIYIATGLIEIENTSNSRDEIVQVLSPKGELLRTIGKQGVDRFTPSSFNYIAGFAISRNLTRIYISDQQNYRIQVFSYTGEFLFEFGQKGQEDGDFLYAVGICLTSDDRFLYVAENCNSRIQVFDAEDGSWIRTYSKVTMDDIVYPTSICLDEYEQLVVSQHRSSTLVLERIWHLQCCTSINAIHQRLLKKELCDVFIVFVE
jgi:sugar lactone lactonase YvrE